MSFFTALAHSPLTFSTPFSFCRSMPLEADICQVLGFTDNVILTGVRPFLVFILINPLDKSPYSADGTPVTTSMDSMFSTATLLVPTPEGSLREALLPKRTPSISTAVPKAALPMLCPPSLRERILLAVRSGLTVLPPGSRAAMSDILDICRWSSASRPMLREVFRPSLGLWAVTVTSSRAREFGCSRKVSESRFVMRSISMDWLTYPRQDASAEYLP